MSLKAFVRYDKRGRIIPGSLTLRETKPQGYVELVDPTAYQNCCNTTTTTLPEGCCFDPYLKFDVYQGGFIIEKYEDCTALIMSNTDLPEIDYDWAGAQAAAAAFTGGGYTDWRIPTLAEITTIANSIWVGVLPIADFSFYWTSTEIDANNAWRWDFGDGTVAGPQFGIYNQAYSEDKLTANVFAFAVRTGSC